MAAPSGPCGRETAPAAQPTGRALTKGIWSFFQNKYKNHVKQLDSRQAVSCWKCHVEPHDVGVIKKKEKKIGGCKKTSGGSAEGRPRQLVLPACGCVGSGPGSVGRGGQSWGTGRRQLRVPTRMTLKEAAFCVSGPGVWTIVSATAIGDRKSVV